MIIRPYIASDKEQCIAIFQSNFPKFFDKEELPPFINWLEIQGANKGPAYANSEKDEYYVIEEPGTGIVACGGFYLVRGQKKANLAWGMVHADHHKKGYGTLLYKHRRDVVRKNYSGCVITLGTSQHTFPFYERMGMKVVAHFKAGYGPGLDRFDMVEI